MKSKRTIKLSRIRILSEWKWGLSFIAIILFYFTLPVVSYAGCNDRMKLNCGQQYSGDTNNGKSDFSTYNGCGTSLTGYHAKEVVYYVTNRPNYVHDIFVEFEDVDKKGLDIFVYRNACELSGGKCLFYKLRSGSDNKNYSFTIKNADPQYEYYIFIDAKNGTGRYKIKATCQKQGYICNNYINMKCGQKYSGHTNNGENNYHDYKCFDNSLTGYNAKEVVYKIIDRPNYYHDIDIELYDKDRRGLDLYVIENCGESNYQCYTYKIRSSNDPEKSVLTIYNTNPNKHYYVIIDAKNSTGNYEIKAVCKNNDYACNNAVNIKCGETKSGNTSNGHSVYNDYSCFKNHLTGFHAKERVYRITNYPSSTYDMEVTFEDLDDRGLDLFIVENCGKNDYKCYDYKERSSKDPKKCVFTLYNLNHQKEYYIIIDAKQVTGRYKLYINCKKKGYICDNYISIDCGESKYGDTKNGHANYDNYSCFDNHLTGFYAKELVYKIQNRPDYVHDIYIDFEDIYDKGLDIFVVENCGKNDYQCYAHKERFSSDPKKDKLLLKDTDPNKDYYIIIDAKSITSAFNLSIRCEDNTKCYAPCFYYVKQPDGRYDFYLPDEEYNQIEYYSWYFEKMGSGESDSKSKGNISGYQFKHGSGKYKVALRDKFNKILCYYYLDHNECDDDLPMAKPFSYEVKNCSGDDCNYEMDASNSMGSNLTYHWYFIYNDKSKNRHYQSENSKSTVAVPDVNDLVTVCLVITNPCGMATYCLQGDCFNSYPNYTINKKNDREIELQFDTWNVNCSHSGRKVRIDWGNGEYDDYDYTSNLKPKYTYAKPGYYYVCVHFYYECSGNNYERGCTICICKTITLGCEEIREYDCQYLGYEQGDFEQGQWYYKFSHTGGPQGYDWQYYQVTDLSNNQTYTADSDSYLYPGRDYLICAVYRNNEGCYYYCCKQITVYYPTNYNIHLPSLACGGNGSMAFIPVTVNGFNELTGFQFKIRVNDANVAAIQEEISNLNSDLPLDANDVTVSTAQNLINVAWTTNLTNQSQSLDDGDTLFVFKVMFTGSSGDSTVMEIIDALAFNNITNQQVDVTFDNGKLCVESSFSIQGVLTKEDGTPLANTTVGLSGDKVESTTTDENGIYQFNGLIRGYYEVTPVKSQDYHAGVNVIDLATIKAYNRDIEGTTSLSAYQLIASNARKFLDGGQLTVADETSIKRMTNFDIDEFSDYSNSWTFIPKTHTFSNPQKANLESYPNSIVISDLTDATTGADFYGIKIGDINGSVSTLTPRSSLDVGFSLSQAEGDPGDTILVELKGTGFVDIQNLQFTIGWDPAIMSYVEWLPRYDDLDLEQNSFSTRFVADGKLTFAHSLSPGKVSFADTALFALRFVLSGEKGQTTDISILGDPVEILVTNDKLQLQNVNATNGSATVGSSTAVVRLKKDRSLLGVNRPNPFRDYTVIPFTLNQSSNVVLSIFNTQGVKLIEHQGNYVAGRHRWHLTRNQLGSPGLYFYNIRTSQGQMTRSMVLLR